MKKKTQIAGFCFFGTLLSSVPRPKKTAQKVIAGCSKSLFCDLILAAHFSIRPMKALSRFVSMIHCYKHERAFDIRAGFFKTSEAVKSSCVANLVL